MTFTEVLDTDLDVMTNPDEFGSSVTFNPESEDSYSVNVIDDKDPVLVNSGNNGETISSQDRTLIVKTESFTSTPIPDTDTFTIDSQIYDIWDIQDDGTQKLTIVLKKR